MEPKRLLETETGLSERLLRVGLSVPDPPADVLARTLAAVGSSAELGIDAPAANSDPAMVAGGGSLLSTMGFSKCVLVGLAAGLLSSAVAATLSAPVSRGGASAARVSSPRAEAPVVGAPHPWPQPQPTASSPSPPAVWMPQVSSKTAASSVVESPDSSLADEVKLLDRASAALANGSTAACLKLLNEYTWRFAGGQLEPEARLLRVRAEYAAGNHGRAQRLAEELLARAGTGAFAERVRAAAGMWQGAEKIESPPIKP